MRRLFQPHSRSKMVYDAQFKDFPQSEFWRVYTDGFQQIYGPGAFSENYHLGMQRAFAWIQQSLELPLNPELIAEMQATALIREKGMLDDAHGYRDDQPVIMQVYLSQPGLEGPAPLSGAGLDELSDIIQAFGQTYEQADMIELFYLQYRPGIASISHPISAASLMEGTHRHYLSFDPTLRSSTVLVSRAELKALIISRVEDLVERYQLSIAKAISDDHRRLAIAQLARRLHVLHGFPIGDGRTHTFVLINYLLLKHGMSPMICYSPAHYMGFSDLELATEIEHGQRIFQAYRVTALKKVILTSHHLDDSHRLKHRLRRACSPQLDIALAQINEVLMQIDMGKMVLARADKIMIVHALKSIYLDCAKTFVKQDISEFASTPQTFCDIIKRHEAMRDFAQDMAKIADQCLYQLNVAKQLKLVFDPVVMQPLSTKTYIRLAVDQAGRLYQHALLDKGHVSAFMEMFKSSKKLIPASFYIKNGTIRRVCLRQEVLDANPSAPQQILRALASILPDDAKIEIRPEVKHASQSRQHRSGPF